MENLASQNMTEIGGRTIDGQNEFVLESIYKQYWHRLVKFSSTYLNDKGTCEELVQELFVQLHSRKATLKIKSSISSYLYAALRNRIINYFRARAIYLKHITRAWEAVEEKQNNVEQLLNFKELQKDISGCVDSMPSKYREVIELSDHGHLTVKKIAEVLQRPMNTVDKQLRKANLLLRCHLLQNPGTNDRYRIKNTNGLPRKGREVPQKMTEVSPIFL